ncbi:MAG TPA: protein kinase [Thermoanaerobaculia bacterium]|nr:protein kinase [Thermoanaerobaculia bacterium]HQR66566.1 protein kinase [Thermoanaerobaculia bacterium]
MGLSAGMRLGPYEVLAPLGAGGMGEVWRARDTRLDREVAVKLLPDEFFEDMERKSRFEREAKALAAVSHPNIAGVHSFEEISGRFLLVEELLHGRTLRTAIADGPMPVRQTLDVAVQIAEGLAAAHENGIVHRDVKPENVFLTSDGHVKLLDFGLARRGAPGGDPAGTRSPTVTEVSTPGAVVGTVAYMSPEQARGGSVDHRTDQFSLGIVLYEMLAGLRPFRGGSTSDVIAAILRDEPEPLEKAAPGVPAPVRWIVERCLAKDPADRFDSTRDLASDLSSLRTHLSEASLSAAASPSHRRWRSGRTVAVVAVVAVAATIGVAAGLFWRRLAAPTSQRPAVVRSTLEIGPAEDINCNSRVPRISPGGSRTAMTWTPDGRTLVFVGRRDGVRCLWARALDAPEARPIAGTDGALAPAVSPDGAWIAFWAGGAIRRAPLGGGPVAVLVDAMPVPRSGLSWGPDGRLFYGGHDTIWSVESEHAPKAVTKSGEGENDHILPHALPDGRALIYTVRHRQWTWGDEEVVAQVLATGERKVLLRDAVDARFVTPGYLVFLRRGTLFGVDFDLSRLEIRGTPVPLLEHVMQALTGWVSDDLTGAGQFSVSSSGTLAYLPGPVVPFPERDLVRVDRQGRVQVLGAPRRSYLPPVALSPGVRRLAAFSGALTEMSLWSYEPETGKSAKLFGGAHIFWPRWTPDGQRLSFEITNQGFDQVAWQRADGAVGPDALWTGTASPSSWSPDGRHLALVKDQHVWIGTLEGGKLTMAPWLQTTAEERWPEFSPDGRWLAYGSNASGRWEVYVQPFPGPGPRQLVSVDGGTSPAWSPAGRELFFVSPPDSTGRFQMMVVETGAGSDLTVGRPRPLFSFSHPPLLFACQPLRCYAVSPDGRTFYVTQEAPAQPPPPVTRIHLVQNWVEEVKARVAAGEAK